MACYQPAADDIFDEQVDDNVVARKEWGKTEDDIKKTGYRLGLSAGQEETVQQGFDAGYTEAAVVAMAVGQLQGQISATLTLLQAADKETLTKELTALMDDCSHLQQSIPYTLKTHTSPLDTHPPSHSSSTCCLRENSNNCCGGERTTVRDEDSLREVSDLFQGVGMQELHPISNPVLNQRFVGLLQRYQSLTGQLHLQ